MVLLPPGSIARNCTDWPGESATALGEMDAVDEEPECPDAQPPKSASVKRQKYVRDFFFVIELHPS
jgi:hypothetical protein